jgi:hypothetical protein
MLLFEDDWGVDKSPIESVEITTTILYFSVPELKEFKALCKKGIRETLGEDFQQKGNLSDFLLTILKEKYGSENS